MLAQIVFFFLSKLGQFWPRPGRAGPVAAASPVFFNPMANPAKARPKATLTPAFRPGFGPGLAGFLMQGPASSPVTLATPASPVFYPLASLAKARFGPRLHGRTLTPDFPGQARLLMQGSPRTYPPKPFLFQPPHTVHNHQKLFYFNHLIDNQQKLFYL